MMGYGGVYKSHFIYGKFPLSWQKFDIQVLELYPIFLLVNVFKDCLRNKSVLFHCDNISVVFAINNQTSRNKSVMSLLRPLVFLFLNYNIYFRAKHIPGKINILCDQLSRKQLSRELLEKYDMDAEPTAIPHQLRPVNFKLMSEN